MGQATRGAAVMASMLGLWFGLSTGAGAQGTEAKPVGVVSHVKVLSDKVRDVSSMEAWKRSFIREGMTDEQKAIAVWRSVVMHRYQDSPPIEFLHEGLRPRPDQDVQRLRLRHVLLRCRPTSRPWPATSGWRPAAGRSTCTACRRCSTTTPGTCSTPR